MSKQTPYLQRRGDTFSFRIAVPSELQNVTGKREYIKSLQTTDKNIAVPLALRLAATAKQLFYELKVGMSKPDNSRQLTLNKKTKLISEDEDELDEGEGLRFNYEMFLDLDDGGFLKGIKLQAEPHEQEAVNSAIKTALEHAPKLSQHLTPTSTIENAPKALKTPSAPKFSTVINAFLEGYPENKHPDMFKKHNQVLPMLLKVIGDKPINEMKQADINGFFELLGNLPQRWPDKCRKLKLNIRELAELEHPKTLGPITFEDTYKASVRPFLKGAKISWQDQGFPLGLTTDGIEYLGDREEGENKQRALTLVELKRLFEGREMMAFANDSNLAHCFWLPHVGLYTGARVNEICQLNPQIDIFQDSDSGLWCLWINEKTESDARIRKSVKTGDSRKVPIHKKLIELGFLEYVNRVKSEGAKLLFPKWKPFNRRASGEAEKWFRQLLRETKLRDETPKAKVLGMHIFRHTLLTYGAMQKPPLSLFCITGHAQGDLPIPATGSGKGYLTLSLLSSLQDRATLLDQLDYGLTFFKPKSV
ncbi:MAG: DUF6538 domain-containing protein [Nitrosospira sp.]